MWSPRDQYQATNLERYMPNARQSRNFVLAHQSRIADLLIGERMALSVGYAHSRVRIAIKMDEINAVAANVGTRRTYLMVNI
jgi:hypothetical protein